MTGCLARLKAKNGQILQNPQNHLLKVLRVPRMGSSLFATPGFDVQAEIPDTERLLIANGETPSIFIRLPRLISDVALMKAVQGKDLGRKIRTHEREFMKQAGELKLDGALEHVARISRSSMQAGDWRSRLSSCLGAVGCFSTPLYPALSPRYLTLAISHERMDEYASSTFPS
jgi:hypothetical protein